MINIQIKKGKWTKQDESTLIDLNENGKNYAEISKILNRSVVACQKRGLLLGLKGNNNVDIDFFARNDEVSNYVLGYWLADGCIMNKSGGYFFSIVSNDYEHLEKIKEVMKIKTKIYTNSCKAYEIRVGSKQLVENLIALGGEYKKTKTSTLQNFNISDEYFYDFMRGYFDGDGSLMFSGFTKQNNRNSLTGAKFTGSGNLITSVKNKLESEYGYECSVYEDKRGGKNDCSYLSLYGDSGRRLLKNMYVGSNIYLARKYNKYMEADIPQYNLHN